MAERAPGRRADVEPSVDARVADPLTIAVDASVDARAFERIVEQLPAVVYVAAPDDDARVLYVNAQMEALFGYRVGEWFVQHDMWSELLHVDDRERVLAIWDRHNETGTPWRQEYRMVAHDGHVVWLDDHAVLIRDASQIPQYWLGVAVDITDRKLAERRAHETRLGLEEELAARDEQLAEAGQMMALEVGERRRLEGELHRATERYRRLIEQIPGVVYVAAIVPGSGRRALREIGGEVETLLGEPPASWLADPHRWAGLVHPDDLGRVRARVRSAAIAAVPYELQYRTRPHAARTVWVKDCATPIGHDLGGLTYQGVLLRIAEGAADGAPDTGSRGPWATRSVGPNGTGK